MKVTNKLYIVYGQDDEGRNITPHYFYDKRDACKFAIKNSGKMAYGMPTVEQITSTYNTRDMSYRKYSNKYYYLSDEEIQRYAEEFQS